MESGFQNIGFSSAQHQNAFQIVGKSMQPSGPSTNLGTDNGLRLDSLSSSFPYPCSSKGMKRKWSSIDGSSSQISGPSLDLTLGYSSSSSDSKGSSATACTTTSSAKEIDEESSIELDFSMHIGNEKIPIAEKSVGTYVGGVNMHPAVDLELSLSTRTSESGITSCHPFHACQDFGRGICLAVGRDSSVGLPATKTVYQATQINQTKGTLKSSLVPGLSSSVLSASKSTVSNSSGITQSLSHNRNSGTKTCQVEGCGKGARGASGRCISHGGGRRCQKPGCLKGAEGRTVYCKAHGGGRRCAFLGCTRSAEGKTDFCISHGGGRRCSHEGCVRAARGKSGLCIRHGGGKRCQKENCTKSAEGLSGLCISHGGGRRCQALGCTKGAQGSTMYCKGHGGGKRCTFPDCSKGAEGSTPFCKGHGGGKRCGFQGEGGCSKSVHGGTNFCVAHGGGKRCAYTDCTRSARGRTDFCVRHGGGKRCKFEGCGKSAQGSTDYCKAHGGGKRCSWGQADSEYSAHSTGPCNSFARGKAGLCVLHNSLVQDKRVHGGTNLGCITQQSKPSDSSNRMRSKAFVEDMNIDDCTNMGGAYEFVVKAPMREGDVLAPDSDERVHGGSLLALLAAGSNPCPSTNQVTGSTSLRALGTKTIQKWL